MINAKTNQELNINYEKGIILFRPNRFIMNVLVDKKIQKCHCPCTGKIGQIIFENVPCLLSKSNNPNRKTPYTVEAISIDNQKTWIGINQNATNRYIEHFIKTNQLSKITGKYKTLKREQKLGKSRIDFQADNTYIEVKTPLNILNIKKYSKNIKLNKKESTLTSVDRMIKHTIDLKKTFSNNMKSIMILCFMYDSSSFVPPKSDKKTNKIANSVKQMIRAGTDIWQVNIGISKDEIKLIRYFKLNLNL